MTLSNLSIIFARDHPTVSCHAWLQLATSVTPRHYPNMALVDFCRLVDLYKLRHADARFLPIPSPPLPMSTTPPRSQVEPKRSSFRTPKRDTSFVYDGLERTPSNLGTSSRKRREGDTDRVEGYQRDDYDDYIREDLKSRVFVDFEVFLKSALHVPRDWRTLWGPTIEAVKSDEKFTRHYKEYCDRCEEHSTLEYPFYQPLMETANAVLDVVSNSPVDDISGTPQYYHVNNPKSLRGGVINKVNLTPDLVVLHKDCPLPTASAPPKEGESLKNSKSNNGKTKNSRAKNSRSKYTEPGDTKPEDTQPEGTKPKDTKPSDRLHWANALHILEVKPYDNTICDGQYIPRLIVDGKHVSSFLRSGL